jgi:hypothetical protein
MNVNQPGINVGPELTKVLRLVAIVNDLPAGLTGQRFPCTRQSYFLMRCDVHSFGKKRVCSSPSKR